MLSFQLTHNEFTFASVIMMIQAGAILAYMLHRQGKSQSKATFFLRLFFAFVFLQALVLFVIHGFEWGKALLPFHHVAIVMAGFGLMHFVHHIPKRDQPQLLKLSALSAILLSLFITQYSLRFAYQYLYQWEPGLKVAPFYWSLLPTSSVVFVIGVLIRTARFIPLPTTRSSRIGRFRHTLKSFLTPPNPDVQALRDVAIALLLVFLTAVSVFLDLSQSTLIFVLVVGCLLAVFMIALVYINHAPEPTTFIVKLVGISLFALLTICGWLGLRNIESLRQRIDSQRHSDTELVREMMRGGRLTALPNEVLYVVAWLSEVNDISAISPYYVRSQAELEIKQLLWQNMVEVENIYDIGEQKVEFHVSEDRVSKKNTHSYLFAFAGTTYEVGFSADEFQQEMNQEVNALVLVVIVSSGALILLLPLFFRTNLVSPLNNLLAGVQRANAGDLDVAVKVRYQDEIGFLTDSFNGMIQNLAESAEARDKLNRALQRTNETLELRVTERTAQLAQAVDSAERANRAKSVFLTTMTHELRTPLNGILGYTQILQRDAHTTPKQQDGLSIIEYSGKHLLTLINDVLDLAKIESGKVELLESEFHLPIFLKSIGELMRVRAEQKGIQFQLELSSALPTRLHTDERRLRQVLLNLLSNAVKFTQEGSVTLRVEVIGEASLRFAIIDTGSGIASDEIERIFNPFEQASRDYQAKGTGLGLPISRNLVLLLGSKLQVRSEVGVGSQFWFELTPSRPHLESYVGHPLTYAAKPGTPSRPDLESYVGHPLAPHPESFGRGTFTRPPLQDGNRFKILVVDDNLNNRGVVRDLLSPLGFEIIEAENGQEGLKRSLLDGPSLLITDLVMPGGMDGFELIQKIRQSERSELPIIAASASVYEEDHRKSITFGADAFVHKPIDADLLLSELARLLELESQPSAKRLELMENERFNEAKALILPPPSRLTTLLDLASLGDVAALREELADLSQQDEQFKPFVSQMQRLVQAFAINQICKLLEEYLE